MLSAGVAKRIQIFSTVERTVNNKEDIIFTIHLLAKGPGSSARSVQNPFTQA